MKIHTTKFKAFMVFYRAFLVFGLEEVVGLNLFVASSLTGMDLKNVVVSILPWLGVMVFGLVLVAYVPQISLCLVD